MPSDDTEKDLPASARVPLGAPPDPRGRFEWAGWLLAGAVVAVVMTWPLVRHLRTHIPQDLGDPLGQVVSIASQEHPDRRRRYPDAR